METYYGYVRTPADAIKLFEACRLGLLPRVQRRLSEKERQSIRSGSVFVWDEREAGMRRWTDGKSWSASRVSGSFLTYREMEGKRGGGFGGRRGAGKTPDSGRGSDEDHDDGEPEGYRYKADGLMKQSFSITTAQQQHLHLISYYSRPQPGQPDLPQPTSDPQLRVIVPAKGLYPESSVGEANQTPAMTRAPMQQPYMAAPPNHPHSVHYPPQYGQPGYGWPPSPAATPPYAHYTAGPYIPGGYHLQQPHGTHMHPHYAPVPHYEQPRAALPPPHPPKSGLAYPSYAHQRMPSPPRLPDPVHDHNLQAAAQAVMVDPRLNTQSARNPQGPLPALNSIKPEHARGSISGESGYFTRGESASPPHSSHSDAGASAPSKTSLSALLHHPSGESDDGSRSNGLAHPENADTRALRMLDRSAFRASKQAA
ncbi:hypothetical protein N3K66_003087 [Trichothecium roseum]|uniref:Uncharacterized protein n=1 Tax=Trichothecium roseum TaxID=47278 RepID=A0ACC0V483_9HYPO|nr:hypothetical protein N3K66_003087 [Trichothecium roseum]